VTSNCVATFSLRHIDIPAACIMVRCRSLRRSPYDLRHACATLLLNSGVPPKEVARRLGHSVDSRVYPATGG
jgi:integrase